MRIKLLMLNNQLSMNNLNGSRGFLKLIFNLKQLFVNFVSLIAEEFI